MMTKDGSSGRKQRIRAYAEQTGRSYADAARVMATGDTSGAAGIGLWLRTRARRGTVSRMVRVGEITSVRVAGPLSPESRRGLPDGSAALPYLLQIQVSGAEWLTLAHGASRRFQEEAAADLLTALAARTRTARGNPAVIGVVRDEDDGGPLRIDWR